MIFLDDSCEELTYHSSRSIHQNAENLQSGGHYFIKRALGYSHHFIVVGKVKGRTYYIIEFSKNCLFPEVTLARAYKLTQTQHLTYHLLERNCEHVATWCKTGNWDSEQVKTVDKRKCFYYFLFSQKLIWLTLIRTLSSYIIVHNNKLDKKAVDLFHVHENILPCLLLILIVELLVCVVEIIRLLYRNHRAECAEKKVSSTKDSETKYNVDVNHDDYFMCTNKLCCGCCIKLRAHMCCEILKKMVYCLTSIVICFLSVMAIYIVYYAFNNGDEKDTCKLNQKCKVSSWVSLLFAAGYFAGSVITFLLYNGLRICNKPATNCCYSCFCIDENH